ncbi:MAG: AbrB/MazE/SpoVT family DNA-binding domain-containing protein [Gemmatimonadaceae bacterium]
MMEYYKTITSARQLTLPMRLCEQLGIKRSDKVAITVEHGAIILMPMRAVIEEGFGSLHPERSTS